MSVLQVSSVELVFLKTFSFFPQNSSYLSSAGLNLIIQGSRVYGFALELVSLILLRYFYYLSRIFSKPMSSFFLSGSSDFKSPLVLMCLRLTCSMDWFIFSLRRTVYTNM